MPIEQIARLVGHSDTSTTETVYRKRVRPVIVDGADAIAWSGKCRYTVTGSTPARRAR
jgi:integrase